MSVQQRLKDFIKSQGISVNKFEKTCGLSTGYVGNMRVSIQPDKLTSISHKFPNLNTGWLLTGEGKMIKDDYDIIEPAEKNSVVTGKLVPLYDDNVAVAGNNYGADMIAARPTGTIDVGSMLKDCEAAIRVYGNSMIPNYPAGCVIGTKLHTDSFIEPGHVYVIETRGGRYIKRLYYSDDKTAFQCISDNHMLFDEGPRKGKPCYPEFEIPHDEVIRLHKVVGVIKRNII